MSKALNELIKRIQDSAKRAHKNKTDVGELLLAEIRQSYSSVSDQEKGLIKMLNIIIKSVKGFDDYRETFWSLSGFFELIISEYSTKVVLHTVKAGSAVFNTIRNSDNLVTGWARASIARCSVWLNAATSSELTDFSFLQTIKDVRAILFEVADAGKDFQELIKGNSELKDSIASIKLLLGQPPAKGTKLKAEEKATIKAVKKEVSQMEGLASDAAEGIVAAFEQAVDMEHPTGSILYKANCAMCFQQAADLALQVRAAKGPLAKLAVQAIFNQTEADVGEQFLLAEAVAFIKTLIVPWHREDPVHIETKRQIAVSLQELNLLSALLGQLRFWKVEWNCSFGNCADSTVVAVLELVRHFPEIIKEHIKPDAAVVGFIRTCADRYRTSTTRMPYETAFSASEILECLLDGKPEPPPPSAEELDRRARPWMYNGSFNY